MQHANSPWTRTTRRAMVAVVPILLISSAAEAQPTTVAPGWKTTTTAGDGFRVATDAVRRPSGKGYAGVTIQGTGDVKAGGGVLQQSIRADAFRGKRVKLIGWMKTAIDTVSGTKAMLWMRVDANDGAISSDFMTDRPVRSTHDWSAYELVLDVPKDAIGITFGAILTGPGQLWVDDLSLQPAEATVALTGKTGNALYPGAGRGCTSSTKYEELCRANRRAYDAAPPQPKNLDFEQALSGTSSR